MSVKGSQNIIEEKNLCRGVDGSSQGYASLAFQIGHIDTTTAILLGKYDGPFAHH